LQLINEADAVAVLPATPLIADDAIARLYFDTADTAIFAAG